MLLLDFSPRTLFSGQRGTI